MNDSTIGGSTVVRIGPTPRPVGEPAIEYGPRKREEVNKIALANTSPSGDSLRQPPRKKRGMAVDPSATESKEISRASTRFKIEFADIFREDGTGRRRKVADDPLRAILLRASYIATNARNVMMRHIYATETAKLDEFVLANGHMPRALGEWLPKYTTVSGRPSTTPYVYQLGRRASPELYSGIVSTLADDVASTWSTHRHDTLIRQVRSPVHYRVGQPIPIRKQDVKWSGNKVTFTLFPKEGRVSIQLEPRDEHQEEILKNLTSGDWRSGPVVIQRDRLRFDRWYLRVQYKRLVEKQKGKVSAAINRGLRFFLVGTCSDHEDWVYEGADIEAYLKQIQRRRKSYQYQVKASMRVGHGRTRTLRPIEHLSGKAERWRSTRCQTLAARFVGWCKARKVARLYVEDFSGIRAGEPERMKNAPPDIEQRIHEWPYFRLQTAILSAAEREGIEVVVIDPAWISQWCPNCRHLDEKNRDLKHWRMKCVKCGWNRHLDVAASHGLRARGEALRGADPKDIEAIRASFGLGKLGARKAASKDANGKGNGAAGGNGNGKT